MQAWAVGRGLEEDEKRREVEREECATLLLVLISVHYVLSLKQPLRGTTRFNKSTLLDSR